MCEKPLNNQRRQKETVTITSVTSFSFFELQSEHTQTPVSLPLPDAGFEFDICYTSVLKRATRTLWHVLDSIDQMWVPVHRTWRLNERHYGGLTGLNKAETAAKHGEAQVKIWRRSFDIPPPPMGPDHDYYAIISKVRYHIYSTDTTSELYWPVRKKMLWYILTKYLPTGVTKKRHD